MLKGVCYVAYGEAARSECRLSILSLQALHPNLPICVLSDRPLPEADRTITDVQNVPPYTWGLARWPKLCLNNLSPFPLTCYLDADTRVRENIMAGFEPLEAGWDMAIVPSENQDKEWLWHISEVERDTTASEIGGPEWALQLQGGVWFIRRGAAIDKFFSVWRREWQRFEGQDQGALMRALRIAPIRMWLLGRPWNGGAVIQHRFGAIPRSPGGVAAATRNVPIAAQITSGAAPGGV